MLTPLILDLDSTYVNRWDDFYYECLMMVANVINMGGVAIHQPNEHVMLETII